MNVRIAQVTRARWHCTGHACVQALHRSRVHVGTAQVMVLSSGMLVPDNA